jgi:hypothetical protein
MSGDVTFYVYQYIAKFAKKCGKCNITAVETKKDKEKT